MSDSKDYVSRSDELGNIHISEEVLAAISAAAAEIKTINLRRHEDARLAELAERILAEAAALED